MTGLLASLPMTTEHLDRARESAQRTYDRRRARRAAGMLAEIPPNRWDDETRRIICTLATIAAPSRIDPLLEAFDGQPADHLVELGPLPSSMCLRGHAHGNAELAAACDMLPGAHVAQTINAYDSGTLHTDAPARPFPAGWDRIPPEGTESLEEAMGAELERMGLHTDAPARHPLYPDAVGCPAHGPHPHERPGLFPPMKCLDCPECVHDNGADYHA